MAKHTDNDDIADWLGRASSGDTSAGLLRKIVSVLRRSLRVSRKGVSLSGQGMSDLLLGVAPRLPIRNREALEQEYGGMNGPALAGHLIRTASRRSAGVGATTGALASAGELAPPFWVMLPVEIVAETLVIAAIEMKLVAELHELYGVSITGAPAERGAAIMRSWSERRGIDPSTIVAAGSLSKALDKNARSQLMHMIRRKLLVRAARNISSLAPLLIGAVAGAEINRRATRDLGDALVSDLARHQAQ